MKSVISITLVLGVCGLAVADDQLDPVGTWKCAYKVGDDQRMSTLTV